jgi:hypothetical protein
MPGHDKMIRVQPRPTGWHSAAEKRTARDARAGSRKRSWPAALCAMFTNEKRTARDARSGWSKRWRPAALCAMFTNEKRTARDARSGWSKRSWPAALCAMVANEKRTARDAGSGWRKRSRPAALCAMVANDELAQNGVRREAVPGRSCGARRTLCAAEERTARDARSGWRKRSWPAALCAIFTKNGAARP